MRHFQKSEIYASNAFLINLCVNIAFKIDWSEQMLPQIIYEHA